ncbi:MAG: DUF72 domain-containing protein [Candidatus Helarchaeota archaeon]|nr:DUF72 domain-containing protein [Candidatus Helarchaeota archaeon]
MEKIYVGCAGWEYSGWMGTFYPKNLKKENHLRYYSDHFNFMEINSTFYNLPKEKTVRHWLNQVPKHFLFAIKVWQKITHKKSSELESLINSFFKRMKILEPKTYGYLLQFPPKFRYNDKNLKYLTKILEKIPSESSYFLEFRDNSWFNPDILEQILQPPNLTLVTSYIIGVDPYYYPEQSEYYIRLIGDHQIQVFNQIQREQDEALTHLEQNLRLFEKNPQVNRIIVIFNNNFRGFAPEDANQLIKRMEIPQHYVSQQKNLLDFMS